MNIYPRMSFSFFLVFVSAILLGGCASLPASPPDFYNTVQTNMPLEAKYTSLGDIEVTSQTYPSGQKRFSEYTIWYPKDIAHSKQKYPVVLFANGSGVVQKRYESVFKQLASWGFVVIGNDDGSSWDGSSTLQSLAFLQGQNQNPDSPLYQKLNFDHVGVSGHSQGGVGAINAASELENGKLIASIYTASTPKHALAIGLKWPYSVERIRVPYFMVAGTGVFDAGDGKPDSGIAPLASMKENFASTKGNGLTVLARRRGTDHGDMLYVPNGYMVAWFRYTLMGDAEAGKVFTGKAPEITRNTKNWSDVLINNQ